MNKKINTISVFILVIVVVNLFAYSVRHVTKGGGSLGFLTKPLIKFSEFPLLVKSVFIEIDHPERLIDVPFDFKKINDLDYDTYVLHSHFKDEKWVISLTNLKNDSILYNWNLKKTRL